MAKPATHQHHYVYVIELKPHLLGEERIALANPGYRYRADRPLLYVGMTGRTPEIRYVQHRTGYKASRYTRRNCVALRRDLFEHLGPMTRDEAAAMEVNYADELRSRGYAVWQN